MMPVSRRTEQAKRSDVREKSKVTDRVTDFYSSLNVCHGRRNYCVEPYSAINKRRGNNRTALGNLCAIHTANADATKS